MKKCAFADWASAFQAAPSYRQTSTHKTDGKFWAGFQYLLVTLYLLFPGLFVLLCNDLADVGGNLLLEGSSLNTISAPLALPLLNPLWSIIWFLADSCSAYLLFHSHDVT